MFPDIVSYWVRIHRIDITTISNGQQQQDESERISTQQPALRLELQLFDDDEDDNNEDNDVNACTRDTTPVPNSTMNLHIPSYHASFDSFILFFSSSFFVFKCYSSTTINMNLCTE